MNISIPSPRFKKYNGRDDLESSPKTPSDRPLMYTTPPSSSSFDGMEDVPMLAEFGSQSNEEASRRSDNSIRRRQVLSFHRYKPFIGVMVLAFLCYIYLAEETSPDSMAMTEDQYKNGVVADTTESNSSLRSSYSHFTASPSAPQSPEQSSPPTASPSAQPSTTKSLSEIMSKNEVVSASNDINRDDPVEVQEKKNNLVLHIGPQKTGSTTLQDAWTAPFGILSQTLELDNYEYRFVHPRWGFFDCDVSSYGGYQNCEASQKLKNVMQKTKNAGKNLLLSDENLDERFPESLRDVIDENVWDVTVIVVYRRIHEWLFSWYDQINKTTKLDAEGNILRDSNGHPYRREHMLWPDEGGVPIPTFSTWYRKFTKYWNPSDLVSHHRSIAFMNAFKPYFQNIVVHNMHQDGDLTTNFMCDSFPNAPHSCNLLKNRPKQLPRDNRSVNLDYDILAVKARENGVLKTSRTRKEAVHEIEKFIEKTGKKIPRTCDKTVIEEIKKWLIDSEHTMFPEEWSDQKKSDLNELFDDYVESGKLCDIAFDEVFRDEEWMEFFDSQDKRPHLILHIGPQKTGSTTLQHVWDAPMELRNVLEEDNFDYYFINPHRGMFDCGLHGDTFVDCKVSDKLRKVLGDASKQGKNLILSDENLDERFPKALRNAISDNDFRVKIVLVYRRIHRWLPSWYSQINKSTNIDSEGNILLDEEGKPHRQPHTHWPSEGGVHVPDFSNWYRSFIRRFSTDVASHHPSIFFKNAYEPYFDDIRVYDMEQEGDLVTNFMCQMVPEAIKTCNHLKDGKLNLPLENTAVNVEHDIVSVQAFEHGLIDEKLSRPEVVSQVKQYIEQSGIKLPRNCDKEILDSIHGWLFDSEKLMFPDRWSPAVSNELESKFDSYSSSGKLCDVDIEKVLNDKGWIDFFASLGK